MINLNDDKFGGVQIFNDGVAGKVSNVTIEVEKKASNEPDSNPDYNLFAIDKAGNKVKRAFWYWKPNPQYDDKTNESMQRSDISVIVALAKAVMGDTYELPEVGSIKEAYDVIFKLVKENAGNKKFNVFATYGTTKKPSIYIGLRKSDFIEPADTIEEKSRLVQGARDIMERILPDAPVNTESFAVSSATSTKWV
jgi:hypothetical protein